MNSTAVSILVILICVVLLAPRRTALLGMIAGALYITELQTVEVLKINMFAFRFLEIAGFIRILMRREFSFSNLNEIDRAFIVVNLFTTVVFLLRSNEGQAYQIGLATDAFLCYFTFRGLIGGFEDFRWFLRAFVILLLPYVALLLVEKISGSNPFGILNSGAGGVWVRGDRVRCFGSFRNPSVLGSLGACFLPLYIGLAFSSIKRWYAISGIILCLGIVWLSNSGGPLNFAIFVGLGWILWKYRARMYTIRRIGLALVIALASVMKAPVWYLPAKISDIYGGGDAWHRSYLIDVFISHLSQWWLWGMPMSETRDWLPYMLESTGSADITNEFIGLGLAGGLVAIALFVWLLIRALRSLGKELAATRLASPRPCENEYLLWGLGVMLIGHMVNLLGITYFDQFYVIWYMQLAAIANLAGANHGSQFIIALSDRMLKTTVMQSTGNRVS